MSHEFEVAKAITQTYAEGMKQGAAQQVFTIEHAIGLIDQGFPQDAKRLLEEEVRRIKGLPF